MVDWTESQTTKCDIQNSLVARESAVGLGRQGRSLCSVEATFMSVGVIGTGTTPRSLKGANAAFGGSYILNTKRRKAHEAPREEQGIGRGLLTKKNLVALRGS